MVLLRRIVYPLLLATMAFAIVLAPAELLLRLRANHTPYHVLPADLHVEFDPLPGVMPGIEGTSFYSTTAGGVRGRPYREDNRINILAIGGSTTECLYLDDGEAWPALVEKQLASRGYREVWVGNVAVSGMGTAEHVLVARHYLPQLRIDFVLVLAGINDLTPALRRGASYSPASQDPDDYGHFLDRTFRLRPLVDPSIHRSFPENLALVNLAERGYYTIHRWSRSGLRDGLLVEDRTGEVYERRRAVLRGLPTLDGLPDLGPALARYRRNLAELVETIRDHWAQSVLLTQPSIWHAGLSPDARHRLWIAFQGDRQKPRGRYRASDLERAMDAFNAVTLQVCRSTRTICIDLAAAMADAEDESYFYDDVHFNERGSQRVAGIVADHLAALLHGPPSDDATLRVH